MTYALMYLLSKSYTVGDDYWSLAGDCLYILLTTLQLVSEILLVIFEAVSSKLI